MCHSLLLALHMYSLVCKRSEILSSDRLAHNAVASDCDEMHRSGLCVGKLPHSAMAEASACAAGNLPCNRRRILVISSPPAA